MLMSPYIFTNVIVLQVNFTFILKPSVSKTFINNVAGISQKIVPSICGLASTIFFCNTKIFLKKKEKRKKKQGENVA